MLSSRIATLLCVAETRNFTKSADMLSLTQPAVSQHIKALENELDTKIFNRSQKELRLTEEGEIVVAYARKMQVLYDNMRQELDDRKHSVRRLVVGVTPTAESHIISQVLAIYCEDNPRLHITILTDMITNLYAKLRNYEVDLAVVEGAVTDPDFNSILLDTDYLVLAVANDNPLAKKKVVTLEELKGERLILRLPNSGTRTLLEQTLVTMGDSIDSFNVTLEVDNNNTIKELVRGNFGVSVLSSGASMDYVRKGYFKTLPVENLSMMREINIVYNKDFRHGDVLHDLARIYNEESRAQAER